MDSWRCRINAKFFSDRGICVNFARWTSAVLVLLSSQLGMAQAHNRIPEISDTTQMPAYGNIHPLAQAKYDEGKVPGSMPMRRITIVFNRTPAQQAELEMLLKQQQDPSSSNYHKWLTPAEYATRFGLSEGDLAKVVGWLEARGFKIVEKANTRSFVAFSGTAAQVESALGTALHHYEVDGEVHIANATEPLVPSALASVVLGFRALNDFRPRPRHAVLRKLTSVRPEFTSSISGNHFLAPDDLATIYDLKPLYDKGLDGTGQTIAVMGQTDILQSDVQTFRGVSGLAANTVQVVLVPGSRDPGVVQGDITEADLDLEWAGAVARNASLVFVNSGNGVFDSLQYSIDQNLAPVISISYGDCEQHFSSSEVSTLTALLQQANAQGITVAAASGDSGAADCDFPITSTQVVQSATHGLAVDLPASSPNVTGVGGTQFNEAGNASSYWSSVNNSLNGTALSYIPEIAWNETATELANGGSIAAGGGGASTLFSKPSWQAGIGVPNDNARDVPDISLNAGLTSDGYLICSQGSCVNGYRAADSTLTVVGGTSAGTPAFAGIVALLNQLTGTRQGNVNPRLYQLAAASSDAFHDIASGNNMVPCTAGSTGCPNGGQIGYSATAGYDLATGLGSIDAYRFAMEWNSSATSTPAAPDFQLSGSTQTLTFNRGSSSSLTVSVGALNGFTGNVALTCSVPSTLTNVNCLASPGTIAGTGNATVTLTASNQASGMRPLKFLAIPATDTFALIFGLLFTKAGNHRANNSQRWKGVIYVLLIISILLLGLAWTGCGGGGSQSTTSTTPTANSSSPSTPVTGTVVVQGTSGADIHIVPVSVTVN
jgi:subtilase family serine protease